MLRWVLLSPFLAGCASGASAGAPHAPPTPTNTIPGPAASAQTQKPASNGPSDDEEAASRESSMRPRLETARSAFGKFESKMIDEYRCKVSFVWDDGAKDTVLTTERCSGPDRLAHLSRVLQSGATLPNGDEFFLFGERMGGPNVEGWVICWAVFVRKGNLRVSHIKLPDVPEGRLLEGASGTVELLSESLDGLTTRPCTVSFEGYRCSEQTRPCTVSFESYRSSEH